MIDPTNDAMAWSCKFPVAELETGKTLDDDNSIIVDASSMKSVSYHVKHTAYDVVWVGEWRGDKKGSIKTVCSTRRVGTTAR